MRKSVVVVDGFEGLSEVVGERSAAVIVCCPAWIWTRLGVGYATATPDTLQRRLLDSSGTITTVADQVTVRIDRRAYSPVLRQASLPPDTTIRWWHGRRLHFEFS